MPEINIFERYNQNLENFVKTKNAKIIKKSLYILNKKIHEVDNDDRRYKTLLNTGLLLTEAKKDDSSLLYIVFLAENSIYNGKKDFRIMLDILFKGKNGHIICFTYNTKLKNILTLSEEFKNINIQIYNYTRITIDPTKHIDSPEISVVDESEIKKFYTSSDAELSTILANDPLVIWSTAQTGDIVKLSYRSEVCHRTIQYKKVK